MTDQLTKTLEVLFSTFPPLSGAATPDGAKAAMQAYFIALEGFEMHDIAAGVQMLVAGRFPEHDGKYTPTAPQLGRAVRKALENRLDRERDRRPQLPPPDIEKSPESQARVRAKLDEFLGKTADTMRTPDAAADHRRAELQRKTDERFAPNPSPKATAERLGFLYTAGDDDGDRDVA